MDYKDKYIKYKKKYYQTKQSGGEKDDCEDTINQLSSLLTLYKGEELITEIKNQLKNYKPKINYSNESKGETYAENTQKTSASYNFRVNNIILYKAELNLKKKEKQENEQNLIKKEKEYSKLLVKIQTENNDLYYDILEETHKDISTLQLNNITIQNEIDKINIKIGIEEELPNILNEYGFKLIDMMPDGDCLFYALSEGLKDHLVDALNISSVYEKYGHKFLKYYLGIANKSRENFYKTQLYDEQFEGCVLRKTTQFGDDVDIMTCAFIFGKDIIVCDFNENTKELTIPTKDNQDTLQKYFASPNVSVDSSPIYLLVRKEHYDLLQKL